MRLKAVLVVVGVTIFCAALGALGHSQTQPLSEARWSLPRGLAVKDAGPRTYKFVVEYNSANSRGDIFQRQRFTGEYGND